jgi:hypothetical protein
MDVFFCKLARTNKKLDPTRAPAQGISFRPTQEIAFGNDTSKIPCFVECRQSADLVLEH